MIEDLPCTTCLKYPICRNKFEISCEDLGNYYDQDFDHKRIIDIVTNYLPNVERIYVSKYVFYYIKNANIKCTHPSINWWRSGSTFI